MGHKRIATLVVLASATLSLVAQEDSSNPPIAYGYNHTIEVAVGAGCNLKNYDQLPDQGAALFVDDVWNINFCLRYSYFFGRHWGAFAQAGGQSLHVNYDEVQEPLYHIYNRNGKEVRCWGAQGCGFTYNFGTSCYTYLIGPVYRYDVGRWSFRPRLGVGFSQLYGASSEYMVVDTHTDREYVWVEHSTVNRDGTYRYRFNAFAYSPSLQVTYSVGKHFFFLAEAQWTGTIGHLYQRTKVDQYRAEEPQDWKPAADGYFYIKGEEKYVCNIDDVLTRVQMGNLLQFRLGVGWNIGFNRNAKR